MEDRRQHILFAEGFAEGARVALGEPRDAPATGILTNFMPSRSTAAPALPHCRHAQRPWPQRDDRSIAGLTNRRQLLGRGLAADEQTPRRHGDPSIRYRNQSEGFHRCSSASATVA